MKWITGIALALFVLMGTGWIFRAEIALFGIGQLTSSQLAIGPNQEITWSTGTASGILDPSERPPNIVLILADDLGWNDLSMNGPNPTTQTPNIDALAAQGVTFSQGYAANASCAPSRAALMSGRYATRFGFEFTPTPPGMIPITSMIGDMQDRPLLPPGVASSEESTLTYPEMGMPPSEITLAELLADVGYHTLHIGKWHLGLEKGTLPHDQGFAESLLRVGGLYARLDDPDVIQARQDFDPIDRFLWAATQFAASFNGGPLFEPPKYLTDYYTDEAVKAIEANKDRPFFLYLSHWAPHTPLQATREDYEALSGISLHRERVYAAMIRALDRSVGRVMDALKSNGLDENTLVIFTSDNGGAGYIGLPEVNDPYRGWKGSFFEGGIRVPLLARWPASLPSGSTYHAPVHHFDIYTTAATAAGADLPTDRPIDGVDLTPYLISTDVSDTPHEYLFFRSGAAQAVRDEQWKLVVSAPPGLPRREWLFDLTANADAAGEWNDLLAEQPRVADRLRDALEAHNSEQVEPLWPWTTTTARNVDRDLSQPDQPGDEFAYWSN